MTDGAARTFPLRRRELLGGGLFLGLTLLSRGLTPAGSVLADDPGEAFDAYTVRSLARELAQQDFKAPSTELPDQLKDLGYDRYRMLRFNPDRALWRGEDLPFQVQFFHRGFLFASRVDLFQVVEGRARPLVYSPDLFDFGEVERPPAADLGFAGFRIHAPINRSDYFDEICSFLGASYFRAVAKDQTYGLSARGLSINTGGPDGEEFPLFRAFWIERPQPGTQSIVVHALLDSRSAAAAFRFTIRPGDTTVFDVEMTLYPRVEMKTAGIGTLTSMFYFDANDRDGIDDYRPGVHDSDGLAMLSGRGEQLWRPLSNPTNLQLSAFGDTNPRGFGLMQRQRAFQDYQDLEARYERRPSLWIEPIGDWGEGSVVLVEIPTDREIHDNIVAFWRPRQPLRAKGEYSFTYRMHWCGAAPWPSKLATVAATRVGAGGTRDTRLFVLDLQGEVFKDLPADTALKAEVSASKGRVANVVAHPNPEDGGWRIAFELAPDDAALVELRAVLMGETGPLSESWIYRWSA